MVGRRGTILRYGLELAIPSLTIGVLLSFASATSRGQSPASAPTIRSTTQLVQVTVVATSRLRQPLLDLKKKDFTIWEAGREQAISTFSFNGSKVESIQEIPPVLGNVSNYVDPGRQSFLNVVLLDQADTRPKTWARNLPSVTSFLKQISGSEPVAVYLLDAQNGLMVIQDYNDDRRHLASALQQLQTPGHAFQTGFEDSAEPSFANRNSELMRPDFLSLGQTRGWANALTVIADHVSGLSGRKSLIWLAGSFPDPFMPMRRSVVSLDVYRRAMLSAVNKLIAADVAIYAVDARGLTTQESFDVENENISIGPAGPGDLNSLPPLPDFSPLMHLASHSGGKAFFNTNGIAQSMEEAAVAGKASYTLGFYTSAPADNKFHKLAVSVKREGVRLRYRPGYWALSSIDANGTSSAEGALKRALESPFMVRSVGLQATANHTGTPPGEITVTLYIDSADLTTSNAGNGSIDVIFGQKDNTGKVFAVPPREVPLQIPANSHPWLTTQVRLALRTQSSSLRIVVRNRQSGRLGSLDIPLTRTGS